MRCSCITHARVHYSRYSCITHITPALLILLLHYFHLHYSRYSCIAHTCIAHVTPALLTHTCITDVTPAFLHYFLTHDSRALAAQQSAIEDLQRDSVLEKQLAAARTSGTQFTCFTGTKF